MQGMPQQESGGGHYNPFGPSFFSNKITETTADNSSPAYITTTTSLDGPSRNARMYQDAWGPTLLTGATPPSGPIAAPPYPDSGAMIDCPALPQAMLDDTLPPDWRHLSLPQSL